MDSDNPLNTMEVLSFITAYELALDPYHYCDVFLYIEVKLYFTDGLWMNLCESKKQVLFERAPLISFLTVSFVVVNKIL